MQFWYHLPEYFSLYPLAYWKSVYFLYVYNLQSFYQLSSTALNYSGQRVFINVLHEINQMIHIQNSDNHHTCKTKPSRTTIQITMNDILIHHLNIKLVACARHIVIGSISFHQTLDMWLTYCSWILNTFKCFHAQVASKTAKSFLDLLRRVSLSAK